MINIMLCISYFGYLYFRNKYQYKRINPGIMKKLVLVLALAGFMGAGATPAMACEGGKCKMEHADKDKKGKKDKKTTASAESCHMKSETADAGKPASCCVKKDAKADASKAAKATKDIK
ncbi:hypothetical protein [Pontibacter populi]|uniref:Uncharacterized protein n=1 Tax=Pontibacter populi TaxID=890055 RepID=A0ABV1RW67_9BACT